jgi:septal ring factor EnvC (AmiA/AmiB activator)
MNPELLTTIATILGTLGVTKGIGWLGQKLVERRERQEARRITVEEEVHEIWAEQTKEQQQRLAQLEDFLRESITEKDAQIHSLVENEEILRQQIVECRRQHAETRIDAATAKVEVTNLKQKVDDYEDKNADLLTIIQLNASKIRRLEGIIERRGLIEEQAT